MSAQLNAPGRLNGPVLTLGLVGLVAGLAVTIANLASTGHAVFNTTSDGVSWGLPVAVYVFLVLASTGLTFVASLAMVFGVKEYYPIAKRCVWLAAATLIAGFVALAFELGHPFRMLWAIPLSFQFTSAMNWMGVFYALYLVFLLLKFNKMHAGDWDSGASRNLGIASFLAVIVAHGTLGLVFGMMAMRPFWYDGLMPIYFLATAFLSGVALAVFITQLAYGFSTQNMPARVAGLMTGLLPKVFAFALGLVILFMAFRTITGLWSNADGLEAFYWMIRSPWFWIEAAALVVAFFILMSPAMRGEAGPQTIASVLVLAAVAIGRYEFVVGGQVVPLFKGSWVPGFIEYSPSFTEWMLTLAAISLAVAIYAFGEKTLDLGAEPKAG
jgi:molybdopterin-containing oxidoreductase family membrane subunit